MKCKKIFLDKIDSTNKWAKEHTDQVFSEDLTIVHADEQTAGKGRFGRHWESPQGENIYATFCFRINAQCLHLISLAQVMTLSIAKILIKLGLQPKIRWPNDILLSNKKVSGVLCEISHTKGLCEVFLGVGINVDTPKEILEKIDQPATCLQKHIIKKYKKGEILDLLEIQFIHDLDLFLAQGFAPFLCEYENLMAYIGEEICCENQGKKWVGICHSLTNDGQLNLYLPNKEIIALQAADVTLRVKK